MMFEPLEPRRLLSVVSVTARPAAAYEEGPVTRDFFIRRDISNLSAPLHVFYQVGGTARRGSDYPDIGGHIVIKAGKWLRRVSVIPIDDFNIESNESVGLTLSSGAGYTIDPNHSVATIRIISNDEPTPIPTKITWTTQAPSPIIRAEALRAVVGDKLFVLGGFSGDDGPVVRSDVYDPATNAWTQIADLPTRLTHAGVAVDGRDIYVAGGYVGIGDTGFNQQFGTTAVWKYNVDADAWTAMPAMPKALAGGGAAVIGRMLHYFGGNNNLRQDIGDHLVLDLDNLQGGWKSLAPLPDPRSHFGYAVIKDKIYVAGGQHGNDAGLTTVSSVHVYNPALNSWSVLASLPVARSHFASAAVAVNGRLIVLGGETSHDHASALVTLYDPGNNAWTALTPLPAPRFSGVAAVIDGTIYFTTGSSQTTTYKGILS
jgi:N-acetylneuraminic acid mutarotase